MNAKYNIYGLDLKCKNNLKNMKPKIDRKDISVSQYLSMKN